MASEFDALFDEEEVQATPTPGPSPGGTPGGSEFDALFDEEPAAAKPKYLDFNAQPETDQALKESGEIKTPDVFLERFKKAAGIPPPPDWSKAEWFDPEISRKAFSEIPGKLKGLWDRRTLFTEDYEQPTPAPTPPVPATMQATQAAAGKKQGWTVQRPEGESIFEGANILNRGVDAAVELFNKVPWADNEQYRKNLEGKKAPGEPSDLATAWQAANTAPPSYISPHHWMGVGMEKFADTLPEGRYKDAMQIQAGLLQGAASLTSAFGSPLNLTLLAAPGGKLAQGLIMTTFAGIALHGTPGQIKRFNEAKNLTEKTKIAVEMAAMWVPVAIPALKKIGGPAVGQAMDDLVQHVARIRAEGKPQRGARGLFTIEERLGEEGTYPTAVEKQPVQPGERGFVLGPEGKPTYTGGGEKGAEPISETTPVHGDVLQLPGPGEGEGGVSPTVGGPGVPPRGPGKVVEETPPVTEEPVTAKPEGENWLTKPFKSKKEADDFAAARPGTWVEEAIVDGKPAGWHVKFDPKKTAKEEVTEPPTETAPPPITRDNPLKMTVGKFYQDETGAWRKITRGKKESDILVTTPKLIKRLAKRAEERAAGTEKPKRFGPSPDDFGSSAETPLANFILGHSGKMMSKSTAKKKGILDSRWDEPPKLSHPSHNKIYNKEGAGETPDNIVRDAYRKGLIHEEDVDLFYRELEKESKGARNKVEADMRERATVKEGLRQVDEFEKAKAAEKKAGAPPQPASELNIGDRVKIGGEWFEVTAHDYKNMSVTLSDGKKYGTQTIGAEEIIHGVRQEAAPTEPLKPTTTGTLRSRQIPGGGWQYTKGGYKVTTVELPDGRIAARLFKGESSKGSKTVGSDAEAAVWAREVLNNPEKATDVQEAKGPKGKPEEELLPAEEQPFNLVGEEPPSGELTKEGAARKKAEDEAKAAKEQMDLFDESRDLMQQLEKDAGVTHSTYEQVTRFGQRLWKKDISFAEWAHKMIVYLGRKVGDHLEMIWKDIVGHEEAHQWTRTPKEGHSMDPTTGYRYALPDIIRLNTTAKTASVEFMQWAQFKGLEIGERIHEVNRPALAHGFRKDPAVKDVLAAEKFAQAQGETVHWYRGPVGSRGFRSGNKVFININNVHRPGGVLRFLVAHEYGHLLQRKYPGVWQRLSDQIKTRLPQYEHGGVTGNLFWERLKELGYAPRGWRDEFISDFIGETLANPLRFRLALGEKPGLFRKIGLSLVDYIDGQLRKRGHNNEWTATGVTENLKQSRDLVIAALEEARTGKTTALDKLQAKFAKETTAEPGLNKITEGLKQAINEARSRDPRSILSTAMRNDKTGEILKPDDPSWTHTEIALQKLGSQFPKGFTDGYLTRNGEFLNREQAWHRAQEVGQMRQQQWTPPERQKLASHQIGLPFGSTKKQVDLSEISEARGPLTPKDIAERAMNAFREEAKRSGQDPNDPAIHEHWKNHLESLPDPGETLVQHRERTPNVQITKAQYDYALENNQIGLAARIKRVALARGVNFEPPKRAGGFQKPAPRVRESKKNEFSVKMPVGPTGGKGGKATMKTVSFMLAPEKIPEALNYHMARGHLIVSAPKGALEMAANLKAGEKVVPAEPPQPMEEWRPPTEDPTPTANAGDGTTTPPPPGTIYSPSDMPAGWSDWTKLQAGKVIDKFIEKWNDWWPASYAAVRDVPDTPVIKAHQQWLKDALDYMYHFSESDWWHDLRKMSQKDINDWEEVAVGLYRQYRDEGMMHPEVAWEKAVTGNALENLFRHRRRREEIEEWAAKELGVKRPKRVDDPYIARLTNREGQAIVELGFTDKYMTSQLRHGIGVFDKPREHATMNDGLAASVPVQYDPTISAVWQRERVGVQLVATARMLKTLREEGALWDTRELAAAASKDGKTAVKVEGIGGKDYWARSTQEARFIEQNFNRIGQRSPIAKITDMMNTYIRNPSLINPLPHVTKNMFFKYILARGSVTHLMSDSREYLKRTNPELADRFDKVFPTPETSYRLPQMRHKATSRWSEATDWPAKLSVQALKINSWSQKVIFEKADPAMRYALWKTYIRKGMGDLEAANNVWIDLIRYDENSGALNFWKQWPGNWFATWRTGTYVTLFKAMRTHPVRNLMFFGAVEYIREIIYRKTGAWTHLPIDYMDAPLAEGIESIIKAREDIHAGRNVGKALGAAATKNVGILATTALFGPGGGQAPDTISKAMEIIKGDPQGRTQLLSMFWGIAQIVNMPGEFNAFLEDGNPKHLYMLMSNLAFGTHQALSYEPRRLMKWMPESMPGMAYSPKLKWAANLREQRDIKAGRALRTWESRSPQTKGFWQGGEQTQSEQLIRSTGKRPQHQGPPPPPQRGPAPPPR